MFSRLNTGTSGVDQPCQPADIAKPGVEASEYGALYFFLVGDDGKRLRGRGSVLSSTWGLANG
jgi:hypothetical protein